MRGLPHPQHHLRARYARNGVTGSHTRSRWALAAMTLFELVVPNSASRPYVVGARGVTRAEARRVCQQFIADSGFT